VNEALRLVFQLARIRGQIDRIQQTDEAVSMIWSEVREAYPIDGSSLLAVDEVNLITAGALPSRLPAAVPRRAAAVGRSASCTLY